MTAMNVFARPDGAWLMGDTGHYHANGRVLWFSSKIVAIERLSLAISTCGRFEAGVALDIEEWLGDQPDQHSAIVSLPDLLRQLSCHDQEAVSNGALESGNDLPAGMRLAVGCWDFASGSATAAIIATTADLAGGSPPYVLRPVRTMFSPPLDQDLWPKHTFDPPRHMPRLAEIQRRRAHSDGTFRVGGQMEAVRIGPQSIEKFIICSWRDPVGRPISPHQSRLGRAKRWVRGKTAGCLDGVERPVG